MKDADHFFNQLAPPHVMEPDVRYLKWGDISVGKVLPDWSIFFTRDIDKVPNLFRPEAPSWSPKEVSQFLIDRLPSANRRDIGQILRRCGLSQFDEFLLAEKTRAVNPKDLYWLAESRDEEMSSVLDDVFKSIFHDKVDIDGQSVFSPEGMNIKRYGVYNGKYGLYKKRLHPQSMDIEAEVAVYKIAQMLKVPCCPAYLALDRGDLSVFSEFQYDFANDYLIHARRLFKPNEVVGELYHQLIEKLPGFKEELQKMIVLDFVTRQTDRHLSNFAFKISGPYVSFYPLYDNGRSLFFEDDEEFSLQAIEDIPLYSTEFGNIGTYWDVVQDIAEDTDIKNLVNLEINPRDILEALKFSGLRGYRVHAAHEWVVRSLELLKGL